MTESPINPIQAPPVGRPRSKGQLSEATRKNQTMRDRLMDISLKQFSDQIQKWIEAEDGPDGRPEPKEVLMFVSQWMKDNWGPIDKRRLIEQLVNLIDATYAEPPAPEVPEY